jgi:cytochrome c oxidase cbb3-type subunit 3
MRSSAFRGSTIVSMTIALLIGCVACQREHRELAVPPAKAATTAANGNIAKGTIDIPLELRAENNSYEVAQGKLLFNAYNCSGCHAQGGGGSGPALMDAEWIYGAQPDDIFTSIVRGRPNGMPSFGARIPEYQVWELVAYLRSMSGLIPTNAAPGRNDAIHAHRSEQLADPQPPRTLGRTGPEPQK